MSPKFIHVVTYVRISFPVRLNNNPFVCICYILFIHSSVDGHWAVVNNAATNMGLQIPLQDPASNSFGHIPRSCAIYCLIFGGGGCGLVSESEGMRRLEGIGCVTLGRTRSLSESRSRFQTGTSVNQTHAQARFPGKF